MSEWESMRGLPMSEIRVGMKLKSLLAGGPATITVTEITEKGFKYSHPLRTMKIGNPGGIPEFGMTNGGEFFGHEGYSMCTEIEGAS